MRFRTLLLGVLLAGCGSSAQQGQPPPGTGSPNTPTAGAGPGDPMTPGTEAGMASPRVARLTHFQWANSVQDLLQLPAPPQQAADFTPDAIIGFDTNASQLWVSNTLRESYEHAAEELARQVVTDSAALAKLIPMGAPTALSARARAFIESFGLKAYRRPLTEPEVTEYLSLFESAPELVPDLEPFAGGALLTIRLFLQSPYFLYRTELGQQNVNGRIPLSGYEVAAKLALALTGSIPDDALLQAAAAGSLDAGADRAAIDLQAQRLLETARGKASALHLHTQALALTRYDLIRRDATLFPAFTDATPVSIRTSAELFLNALYDEGGGIRALLTSPAAFVDSNLAPIYGVSGTFGSDFQRVDLTTLPRRGILTQPGFLALFAGEHEPDPIHRGVFVAQQILCVPLAPPAANVPPLPGVQPNTTNRQRIEALTGKGTCGQGCHSTLINPLGYAFENYDPLGQYRTSDGGLPVDASDKYFVDGVERPFSNALELVEILGTSQQAHRCYAHNWLSYLAGRIADASDDPTLDDLAARSSVQDMSTRDLVRNLAQSDSFLTRSAVQ